MRNKKYLLLVPAVVAVAACSRGEAPSLDAALKSDLALAAQAQAPQPQQFVSPEEQTGGLAPQPYVQPVQQRAPAPRQTAAAPRPVQRSAPAPQRSTSSSGTRVVYAEPAPAPQPQKTTVIRNTKRDAAIGAAAGAVIGAATSKDRVKGGIIGAAAGGVLGGIIGHTVDVKRVPAN